MFQPNPAPEVSAAGTLPAAHSVAPSKQLSVVEVTGLITAPVP
jgi:hypothetical protein